MCIRDSSNVDSRWHNIGIRIEDNILIRKENHENLTVSAPKSVDDIEALMAG